MLHWFGGALTTRRDWRPVLLVVLGAPLAMAPLLTRLISDPSVRPMDTNDFEFHVDLALRETSWWPFRVPAPHPLFHLAVRALGPIFGGGLATLMVMSAAVSLTMLAVIAIGRYPMGGRPGLDARWASALAAVWLVAESPTALYEWLSGAEAPYGIVHYWGSPTEVVFLPAAFLLTLVVGDMLQQPSRYRGAAPAVLVIGLVVVTALAKPSLGLVLAPAVVVVLLTSRQWRRGARPVLALFVVPSVIVAMGQTAFLLWGPMPTGTSGFELAPFEVVGQVVDAGGAPFWFLYVVLLSLLPAVWGRLGSDPCVRLSSIALLTSLVPMILFKETGPRAEDGALLKLGFAAAALLVVFLLRAAMVELRDRRERDQRGASPDWRVALIAGAFALLVVSGLVAYVDVMGVPGGVG